jgi:transcriptional regulator with XRE-family HTH domain
MIDDDDEERGDTARQGLLDLMPMMYTAARIRELVEQSGLTQAEIARRAGLQRDAFGRYMLGKTRTPSKKLISIARVFGVPPSHLDPSRSELDEVAEANPAPVHDYTITPAAGAGMVRLEFSAELPIGVAAEIIEILTRRA